MLIATIATCLFSLGMIFLELMFGLAVIGWTGDNMVVEREKTPGPFWFAIIVHALVGIGFPTMLYFALR